MQLYNRLKLEEVAELHNALFKVVRLIHDPHSDPSQCYRNCLRKVEREGGLVVLGWRRTLATPGAWIIATVDHHAVWQNPTGVLIDITQRIEQINGRQVPVGGDCSYFMPDPRAYWTAYSSDYFECLPSRHIPLVEDTHGYLKQAIPLMDARLRLCEAGKPEESDRKLPKILDLLHRHLDLHPELRM
jgi:hypothetical protein